MSPDLDETIAAIIDPPAWADRNQLHRSSSRVLRESDRTRKMDRARRASSLKKARSILAFIRQAEPGERDVSSNEARALRAEELLSSMMKGGEMMSQALGEASDTFGFLHACMFGAEQHLRENGWAKPSTCNCQAPPTHMSNDCPVHGLDDEEPF